MVSTSSVRRTTEYPAGVKWVRFPRVIGLLICVYLVAMTVFFGYQTTLRFRFVNNAQPVTGEVVALTARPLAGSTRMPNGGQRRVPLAPKVRYVVAGKTYEYTASHGTMGQRLQVGDKVTVLYDPADPAQARLRGEGRILIPLITAGFGTTAIAVAAILILTRRVGD